ncbi:MAG: hypothetical protein GX853_03995 [Chloroflexi bacterium]|nr:hypothetical protein [Chloroflexota bacterium]
MKRSTLFLLTIVLLLGFSSLTLGCSRKLPDIPFGGARATFEIAQSHPEDINALSTPEQGMMEEGGDIDKTKIAADTQPLAIGEDEGTTTAEPSNRSGQDPVNTLASPSDPNATPTPTRFKSDDEAAFFEFWKGDWYLWFEDSGRLLEGKILFEQDGASLVGKTEMDGRTFGFVIKYAKDQDFFENFVYGEWFADDMENPFLFRLQAQNDFQVAGHHSRPTRTFCLSRDAEKNPDPCYVELLGNP